MFPNSGNFYVTYKSMRAANVKISAVIFKAQSHSQIVGMRIINTDSNGTAAFKANTGKHIIVAVENQRPAVVQSFENFQLGTPYIFTGTERLHM